MTVNPYWETETDILELGFNHRAPYYTDEATAIEHRLARATGQQYGRPPRHWNWKPAPSDVPEQP
jgi:hypothetical protein